MTLLRAILAWVQLPILLGQADRPCGQELPGAAKDQGPPDFGYLGRQGSG